MTDDTRQSGQSNREHQSRREFLRAAGRGGALAVVGVVTAIVAARSVRLGQRNRNGEKCVNLGICRTCNLLSDCHLPLALSTRTALSKR